MKTFGKMLPELHVNPINRDLVLVLLAGLILALALGTVATLVVYHW